MRRLRRLALADWPAQDRGLWQLACAAPKGLFEPGGEAQKLRPTTRRNYERAHGIWLAHLADQGLLDPAAAPEARLSPERLDGWLAAMQAIDRENGTIRQYILALYSMLRIVVPHADLEFLLKPGGRPLSVCLPVAEKPVLQVDVADLLARIRVLHRQGLDATSPFEKRAALRDAALLGLLVTRAPRVSNLAMMRLGKHLRRTGNGIFDVRFERHEMKGHRSLSLSLDAECSALMDDYLRIGRGLFDGAASTDAVWLGHWGRPLDVVGIAALVRRHTLRWFGVARGPHTARKWLRATSARRSPEAAFDAAEVCGHGPVVSLRHYAEACEIGAAMRHGQHLSELRRETALLAERAFGGQEIAAGGDAAQALRR